MKKAFASLLALFALLPALTACGKTDYTQYISELRSDIFRAETEEFVVTLSCISREYPYVNDGIPSPRTDVVEIVVESTDGIDRNYSVFLLENDGWGGEMSFRNVLGNYFYSRSVEQFPEGSVNLRIEWEDGAREIAASSVKSEKTITPESALAFAVDAEKETIDKMKASGSFHGEFYVRLLRRDKNYYYVGIVDTDGNTVSLLLDSETGEILARRAA